MGVYPFPGSADDEAMVMLSDILPTGFECGVLNGQVKPGDTVAIVGAGPMEGEHWRWPLSRHSASMATVCLELYVCYCTYGPNSFCYA